METILTCKLPRVTSITEKQEQTLQGQTEQHTQNGCMFAGALIGNQNTEISVNTVRKAAGSRTHLSDKFSSKTISFNINELLAIQLFKVNHKWNGKVNHKWNSG